MTYTVLQLVQTPMNTPSAEPGSASASTVYTYRDLALRWDDASSAWSGELPGLGPHARLHLEMLHPRAEPSVLACEVALATLVLIERLDHDARRYLECEAEAQALDLCGRALCARELEVVCLALPGDMNSDRFALSYRFPDAREWLWTVRFRGLMPLHWRVERRPHAACPAGGAARVAWRARLRDTRRLGSSTPSCTDPLAARPTS